MYSPANVCPYGYKNADSMAPFSHTNNWFEINNNFCETQAIQSSLWAITELSGHEQPRDSSDEYNATVCPFTDAVCSWRSAIVARWPDTAVTAWSRRSICKAITVSDRSNHPSSARTAMHARLSKAAPFSPSAATKAAFTGWWTSFKISLGLFFTVN